MLPLAESTVGLMVSFHSNSIVISAGVMVKASQQGKLAQGQLLAVLRLSQIDSLLTSKKSACPPG